MGKLSTYKEMESLWQESRGERTERTYGELLRLRGRIDASEERRRRVRMLFSAVAVAASLALVSTLTFTLTRGRYRVSPLEGTRSLATDYAQMRSITLEDGTKVYLNAGSSLLYPSSFQKGSRIVYLTGQANFSVAKDASRPFIVKTSYMDVEALGTTFCVQSYGGERAVRTTLLEGKVRVSVPSSSGNKGYLLEPGMQLEYTPSERSVSVRSVDAVRVLDWAEGYLSFRGASFPEIAQALERRFDVSVSYNSDRIPVSSLNVRFTPDDTLEDALGVLTLLLPGSRYKLEENRVFFQF